MPVLLDEAAFVLPDDTQFDVAQVDVERFRRMDGSLPTPTHTYVYDSARTRAESPQLREIDGQVWVEVGAAMMAGMGMMYLRKRRA